MNSKFPLLLPSFENCALEAVTSVCQVTIYSIVKEKCFVTQISEPNFILLLINQSGSEKVLFEKLSSHDLSKFGNLISAIVLKAWPKTEGEKYQDGVELLVQHLLTWPTASKIFQLQGMIIQWHMLQLCQFNWLVFWTEFSLNRHKWETHWSTLRQSQGANGHGRLCI